MSDGRGKMEDVSIPFKYVASIYLIYYIVEARVIAVGDDGFALRFEFLQIVNNLTAEERFSIRDGGLVDNDFSTFGLDTLHDALDGTLAEIIRV